jgi:hypothetical protein
MRHYLIPAAVVAAALAFSSPALSQVTQEEVDAAVVAIEEAELSETAYLNLWCGAAFILVSEQLRANGATADADSVQPFSDAVYQKAAVELIELGVSEEDFTALAQNFRVVAISQTGEGGEADYTQEECTAAAQ